MTGEAFLFESVHRPVVSGECKAAGGERQCASARLFNCRGVLFFRKELADILDRAYQNDHGGAGDAHKEDDLEKSHAKDDQSHKRRLYRERPVRRAPPREW